MIAIQLLVFLGSLILLVKGSDFLVKSSASIAKKLGISEFIIGLTLVAIGTSVPELAASVIAAVKHESGIIIGTAVGANIVRIALVIGVAATISVIKTREEMVSRDGYIMLFAALLFMIFIFNYNISKIEGLILLLFYVAYVFYLFEAKPRFKEKYRFREFLSYFFGFRYLMTIKSKLVAGVNDITSYERRKILRLFQAGLFKDFVIVAISAFLIVIGANFLVDSSVFLANFFRVPQTIIGVTILALGTSLPELSVSITAARKGYGNIVVGTIIGSNIAHIFLVVGLSAVIHPLSVIKTTLLFTAPSMVFISILFLIFIKSGWEIRRSEAAFFLFFYAVFMAVIFFNNLPF